MVPEGLNAFGPLCMQLAQSLPVSFFSLWEGQKWGFFPKDRTYRAFLHNKLFFLIAPRDLHYYWASAQPCAACAVNNTFFSLWECPEKWGFFPKDRTYRAFFVLLHKRNFFRMVPEGLNAFGSLVPLQPRSCQLAFLFRASGKAKNGVFP